MHRHDTKFCWNIREECRPEISSHQFSNFHSCKLLQLAGVHRLTSSYPCHNRGMFCLRTSEPKTLHTFWHWVWYPVNIPVTSCKVQMHLEHWTSLYSRAWPRKYFQILLNIFNNLGHNVQHLHKTFLRGLHHLLSSSFCYPVVIKSSNHLMRKNQTVYIPSLECSLKNRSQSKLTPRSTISDTASSVCWKQVPRFAAVNNTAFISG